MASIEEYVELLLPTQQEKIAMAALRGIRWERIVVKDSTWVPAASLPGRGRYDIVDRTKYVGYLPDGPHNNGFGSYFGDFDDIYECAVRGLALLDHADAPPEQPCGPDAPFALAPGNEQPTPERTSFRWPYRNYRGGKS